MAKLIVKTGSTSRLEHVFILDSTSTTGAGKTGLTNASVTLYYWRPGNTTIGSQTGTLSAGTLGTWSSFGFKEVDATNLPGLYEVGIPDAVFAASANHAVVMIKGTGIAPVVLEYQLVAFDPDSGSNLGLAALPTATTGTAGAIITSGSGTAQLTTTSGVVTANTSQWGGTAVTGMPLPTGSYTTPPTVANIWDALETSITTTNSIGLKLKTNLDAAISTRMASFTYTAPPTVAQIWQTDVSGFNTVGQAGTYLKNAMPTFTYTAPLTTTATAQAVWNALLASYTTADTFGARVVRTLSSSITNEVTIGGSNHIAANVHAMQNDVITAAAIAADATAEIADRVLGRTISGGADGGRTVTSALRILRNKFTAASTTLTVYAEDDTTTAWTSTLSTDAAATPITGSDPA